MTPLRIPTKKRIWQGHKPKPTDKSILRSIAKAKGKGK